MISIYEDDVIVTLYGPSLSPSLSPAMIHIGKRRSKAKTELGFLIEGD